MITLASPDRPALLRRGLRLEALTVGWNLVEGTAAVAVALAAGSVALLGFGLDSFVETASGSIIIWRLAAEQRAADHEQIEAIERRAQRLVAASLAGLAAWIGYDAATTLLAGERPDPSPLGVAIAGLSLGVMWWLARAKRRTAIALGSRAMQADAFQTTACWWLSLAVLVGVGLNTVLGLWWADPVAALVIPVFLLREAREAWDGDACDC
ncbi:MAG TPA: cation transporter [Patescibacteria group bacterium]|nr:cation transporter [Patescibacteria group bacterium]